MNSPSQISTRSLCFTCRRGFIPRSCFCGTCSRHLFTPLFRGADGHLVFAVIAAAVCGCRLSARTRPNTHKSASAARNSQTKNQSSIVVEIETIDVPIHRRHTPTGKWHNRLRPPRHRKDRKSTRLNSSHITRSYAVFCLKKKKKKKKNIYIKKKKKNK